MTWLSPTCFRSLVFLCACVADAATVSGHVTVTAAPKDSSITVVWLSSDVPDPNAARTSLHATMTQKDKHFEPHVLPIEVGTLVDFPNLDPIFHNAFSNFDGQLFDIGLYPPHSSRSIRFRREGLVRVFCNIHPAMSAVIIVLPTSLFTATDRDGRYTIPNVPPGEYKLHFFQERATPETLDALTRSVTVVNSAALVDDVKISEAGYIPMPHKNKYGHDYPPEKSGSYH